MYLFLDNYIFGVLQHPYFPWYWIYMMKNRLIQRANFVISWWTNGKMGNISSLEATAQKAGKQKSIISWSVAAHKAAGAAGVSHFMTKGNNITTISIRIIYAAWIELREKQHHGFQVEHSAHSRNIIVERTPSATFRSLKHILQDLV